MEENQLYEKCSTQRTGVAVEHADAAQLPAHHRIRSGRPR